MTRSLRRVGDGARIALFVFLVFAPRAPAAGRAGRAVVDDLGQRVTLSRAVKKIVSLVPTNSELVCLLDCERLKGGTRYDRFPEELLRRVRDGRIEIIGGGFDPGLERIVQIDPDLILANGPSQERVVAPLRRLGYPVLSLHPRDVSGIMRNFLLLAEILGEEARARQIVEAEKRRLEAFQEKARPERKIRVYLQTWPDPILTVGKNAFSNALISLAGGINIFADMPFDAGKVSLESIISRNPQVMIFLEGLEDFAKRNLRLPAWTEIDAVKKNRVCFVNGSYVRPTIRFSEGLEKLQGCLRAGPPVGAGGS